MPSLHSKWTACLLAVTFVFGITGNASAATNPMTLNDLSQMVLGLKEEVDRLSKANKTLSKKLERIESQRLAARTPSSAYQIGTPERLMKARLSEPVRVASLGTTRVAEKTPTRETKASDLENRITALEKQSHSEIRPYVRYDLAFGKRLAKVGLKTNGDVSEKAENAEFNGVTYPLSVGLGLRINPSIRTDITFEYYSKELNGTRSDGLATNIQNLFVLANAYYDFPAIANYDIAGHNFKVTPYVGGGIGSSYFWGDTDTDRSTVPRYSVDGHQNAAAAAMAGLNVNLWYGLSADIGYRYAYLGPSIMIALIMTKGTTMSCCNATTSGWV